MVNKINYIVKFCTKKNIDHLSGFLCIVIAQPNYFIVLIIIYRFANNINEFGALYSD